MRFAAVRRGQQEGLGIVTADGLLRGRFADDAEYPGDLGGLIAAGADALAQAGRGLRSAPVLDHETIEWLPPLAAPAKIICVGLNYRDHSKESGFEVPAFPTIFARFSSSLVGHGAALVRPAASSQLDYEGELVAVVGVGGRHISLSHALDHVVGYSIFNDGSVRDWQTRTPQWTLGKNFDGTGAFGPTLVTADELPPGCRGLALTTRLNGRVMQHASTDDLLFDVATLVSHLSEAVTLMPGDVIVTGTPSGVGAARRPQVWLAPDDVCEVEIEGVGLLRNPVIDEIAARRAAA